MVIATTINEKETGSRTFAAALQGIDLNNGSGSGEMVDIRELHIGEQKYASDDITSLSGYAAEKAGFGIGKGLGFEEI